MALILAMGTYGAGYIARIIGAFFLVKWGQDWAQEGAVYHYHINGNVHDLNRYTSDLCADRDFGTRIVGDITYYSGTRGRGRNIRSRNDAR